MFQPGSKERPVPNSLKSFFEFRINKIARSQARTLEECLTPSSSDECGSITKENVSTPEVAETSPVTRSTQLETVKLDGEPNVLIASSTQHTSLRNRSTQHETQRSDEEMNTQTVNSTQHSRRNP
ncbi:unnamed protein product [Heligmosomoides polygyrus]|uniref:Uncharacterized protein n=1 Tax=Heligmosomoides polygyrus TaxID=6339 RepID=A0A183GA17_HELPZ|nr:unnamed protein product [Heligmosomoides polygyrus]